MNRHEPPSSQSPGDAVHAEPASTSYRVLALSSLQKLSLERFSPRREPRRCLYTIHRVRPTPRDGCFQAQVDAEKTSREMRFYVVPLVRKRVELRRIRIRIRIRNLDVSHDPAMLAPPTSP
ncbi:unnamed protein product [Diplocarpon coronariae]